MKTKFGHWMKRKTRRRKMNHSVKVRLVLTFSSFPSITQPLRCSKKERLLPTKTREIRKPFRPWNGFSCQQNLLWVLNEDWTIKKLERVFRSQVRIAFAPLFFWVEFARVHGCFVVHGPRWRKPSKKPFYDTLINQTQKKQPENFHNNN